jgi:hypothetical protein
LQIKGLHTSFKESNRRSFRVKILHNELPTLERLTERKPRLYGDTNNKCRMCNQELETREHLFSCVELEQSNEQAWERAMIKMIGAVKKTSGKEKEGETDEDNTFKFQCKMAKEHLTKKIFKRRDDRMKFALGMVQIETILDFSRIFGKGVSLSKASQILSETSAKFLENFRKMTWRKRCKETVETDKILGLDSNTKKRKTAGMTKSATNKGSKEQTNGKCERKVEKEKGVREGLEAERGKTELSVKEKLLGYIKKGIKWLGIV